MGVDISAKMIELAKQQESQKQEDIEYIVGDVMELGKIGSFDLVVASYLLNYARTKEELLKMCQTVYTNLKPGGRFLTINNNLQQCPESYGICEKYGYTKSISETLQEGTPITLTFRIPGDNKTVSFDNYYLSKETYEWAFQVAGFEEIHLHQPIVFSEGIQEFDLEFWQDFLEYAPIVCIECLK